MPPGSALDILVVDDDDALRNMLTRSFEREGHRITSVADGHGALEEAGRGHFDVILLDVALGPGPTGYDIARALRARRNVTPLIMLTALDSEADAVQGLEAGADDYVTKPFGLAELRSRIRAVLRRAHGNLLDDGLIEGGNAVLDQRRRGSRPAGSCCARSGRTAPPATRARPTSTSATCARSSRRRRRTRS